MYEKEKANGSTSLKLVCATFRGMTRGTEAKKLFCGNETVKGFCYLGNRFNASGGSEGAATAKTRIGL